MAVHSRPPGTKVITYNTNILSYYNDITSHPLIPLPTYPLIYLPTHPLTPLNTHSPRPTTSRIPRVLFFDASDHGQTAGTHYDDFEYAVREYGSRDFARDWTEFIATAKAEQNDADGNGGNSNGGSIGVHKNAHSHAGDSPALVFLRNELHGLKDHPVTAALLFGKGEWYRFLKHEKNTLPFLQVENSFIPPSFPSSL